MAIEYVREDEIKNSSVTEQEKATYYSRATFVY